MDATSQTDVAASGPWGREGQQEWGEDGPGAAPEGAGTGSWDPGASSPVWQQHAGLPGLEQVVVHQLLAGASPEGQAGARLEIAHHVHGRWAGGGQWVCVCGGGGGGGG